MSPKLSDFIGVEDVFFDLLSTTKQEVLQEIAQYAFSRGFTTDAEKLLKELDRREDLLSTGIGDGVAIPHARVPDIKCPVAAFLKLARPIDFAAVDGAPVNLVFGLISPEQSGVSHLHALAAISRLMRDESVQASLIAARREDELFGLLSNVIDRNAA